MRPAPPRMGSAWPEPVTSCVTSGLRTVVLERPGPVVALRLTVATGARDDHVAGATHMLEHLLFRTRAGAEARHAVEAAGGEMGATTTREQLSIDVVALPDDLELALDALGRVLGAAPSPTDLERERAVVLREIAHEGEERRLIWQLQAEALYGTAHPLARPILGTAADVEALTPDDLARARARICARSCTLAAVGCVSADAVAALAERLELPCGEPAAAPPAADLPPPGRRHVERRSDLLHVAVGWRFGGFADPSLPALRLAEVILAHGSGSRLYRRLRTERRLAYRVSTILIPYRDAGHVSAVTSCDPHHASQAERAIVSEVERLAARGPTYAELDAARRQHAGMTARRHESSRQLAAWVATRLLWEGIVPHQQPFGDLATVEPTDVRDACASRIRDGYGVASVGRLRPRH
jgi:zinc protease